MYTRWKQLIGSPVMPYEWPKRARIGINGFGQLTRTLIRCALRDNRGLDIVAINEPNLTPEQMIYLLKYDSNHGPFKGCIGDRVVVTPAKEDVHEEYCNIPIGGRCIAVFRCENLNEIPWQWLDVEYVLDTTGKVKTLEEATKHLVGGRARKVLVADDAVDIPLLMYPVSCRGYQRGSSVLAAGSAMAHALATLVALVEDSCGFEECMATLICPVKGNQNLVDGPTKDGRSWRMGRGAMQSVIPGRCCSVVHSVIQALPEFQNKVEAITMNVPTLEGAAVDLVFRTREPFNGLADIIDRLTRSPLLQKLNELHVRTQPFNNEPQCPRHTPPVTSPSSMADSLHQGSDQSVSVASGPNVPTKARDILPIIYMPRDVTSIVVPLCKEESYVSADVVAKHCLCLLSVDCCLSLTSGQIVKVVSWFDTDVSYCERILDTIVYMRSIDHY